MVQIYADAGNSLSAHFPVLGRNFARSTACKMLENVLDLYIYGGSD